MKIHYDVIQQTPEWHYLRKGKITGTDLKAIIGTPKAREDAFYEMIADRLTVGVPDPDVKPMDHGNQYEDEARAMFELRTGKKVKTAGFCESDWSQFVGYSPDGLVDKGTEEFTEEVEIKCPQGKNYVKAWFRNEVPDEYYAQVVQGFIVNEKRETLWFVLYNPFIPVHPIHIIEVRRADVQGDIADYKLKQEIFLLEVETKLKEIIEL